MSNRISLHLQAIFATKNIKEFSKISDFFVDTPLFCFFSSSIIYKTSTWITFKISK